jgi:4-alpha-glucanotransferase
MTEDSSAYRCRAFPERAAGVLLHLTALPGSGPVGSLGAEARHFIDFLSQAGFTWWQICPLGPTGYGDSPYQALSVFAGNPYLLDLTDLRKRGLLTDLEVKTLQRGDETKVNYGRLWEQLRPLLALAAERGVKLYQNNHAFISFCQREHHWLADWCNFSALREQNLFTSPEHWKIKEIDSSLAQGAAVLQFIFSEQWSELKKYAAKHGVKLLGDEPIYVSDDGCDRWAHPELFQLNAEGKPAFVAGVPPDYFSEDGQLWGNPLYDWARHAADGFQWWRARVHHDLNLFEAVRIDHFRGIHDYWRVPAQAKNARGGQWCAGPDIDFIKALGDLPLVAEDLGLLSPGVEILRQKSKLPGMSVIQFGFSEIEGNPHHPENITADRVVYTGTHDNDTLKGWLENCSENERAHLNPYIENSANPLSTLITIALDSDAICAIIPAQDLLELDSESRFNTPGHAQGNWSWRMNDQHLVSLFSQVENWQLRLAKTERTSG